MAQFYFLAFSGQVGGSQIVLAIKLLHRLTNLGVQIMIAVFMPTFAQELVIIGREFDRLQLSGLLALASARHHHMHMGVIGIVVMDLYTGSSRLNKERQMIMALGHIRCVPLLEIATDRILSSR